MTVSVERPYLQQNGETLQNVMKALVEAMVFIASPKNKPAVLETIMKQFKMTDVAPAEGAYQDVVFARSTRGVPANPTCPMEAMRTLQRLLKTQKPENR
jgi:ABC-type nitrate/sulfonate/bicarbonate transport system substrate-binding protein